MATKKTIVKTKTATTAKSLAEPTDSKPNQSKPVNESLRKRKLNKYRSLKLTRKLPHPAGPMPTSILLIKKSAKLIWEAKKPLLGVLAVYILLSFVLVKNFSSPLDIATTKQSIADSLGVNGTGLSAAGLIFGALVGNTGSLGSQNAGVYQVLLIIVVSLAVIWLLRQRSAGIKITAKQAFYQGMYPVIPFLLVIIIILLQTIPALLGGFIYSTVSSSGIAATGYEKAVFMLLFAALATLSFYMMSSSIFALIIVTLPNMTPLKALRSARGLVMSRRLNIARKLLVFILLSLLVLVLIVVPAIYFIPFIAPWLYFALTLAFLLFFNTYLFNIYKALL